MTTVIITEREVTTSRIYIYILIKTDIYFYYYYLENRYYT